MQTTKTHPHRVSPKECLLKIHGTGRHRDWFALNMLRSFIIIVQTVKSVIYVMTEMLFYGPSNRYDIVKIYTVSKVKHHLQFS